jgi:hypothetical protein
MLNCFSHRLACLLVCLGGLRASAAAYPVAASYTANGQMASAQVSADYIRFLIHHGAVMTAHHIVGDTRRVYPSTGAQVFTFASGADDSDYPALVVGLTDGINEAFTVSRVFDGTGFGFGATSDEANVFGVAPDLVGIEITAVRLTVQPFRIRVDGPSTSIESLAGGPFHFTWDVLTVPEPATCGLAALILLARFALAQRPSRGKSAGFADQ